MPCAACEREKPKEEIRKIMLTDHAGRLLDELVICVECVAEVGVVRNGNALDF